jgi:hypothetical protein
MGWFGFWEGKDRGSTLLEIDIAATATVASSPALFKWNTEPLPVRWHLQHLQALDRLSASGVKWAHRAQECDSPLLYLAAGGFSKEFRAAARASREHVYLWSLTDIFKVLPVPQRPF